MSTSSRRLGSRLGVALLLWVTVLPAHVAASADVPKTRQTPAAIAMVDGDRLTARFEDVRLRDALAAVGRAAALRIVIQDDGQQTVSARFQDAEIEHALAHLLRGRSYVLTYHEPAPPVGRRPLLAEVRVLDERGTGDDQVAARPTPHVADGHGAPAPGQGVPARATTGQWPMPSAESLAALAVTDPTPARRVAALNALSRGEHEEAARAALMNALGDAAPSVRLRALQLLAQRGASPPVAHLAGLLHDESTAVRRQAVALLGATSDRAARAALWQAADDRDRAVRELARRLAEASVNAGPVEDTQAAGTRAPVRALPADTAVQAP